MKKVIKSPEVKIDKTKLVKSIIYKLEDADDATEPTMYFTLQGLRFYVVENIWDKWDDVMGENDVQDFSKLEMVENDEYLFAYLEGWNYKITRITYQDVK